MRSLPLASLLLLTACPELPVLLDAGDPLALPVADGGAPPPPGDAGVPVLDAGAPPGPRTVVVFVFDQQLDATFRLIDLDGDGEAMGPGEMTRFFDSTVADTGTVNSQGLVAIDRATLLATDNFAPADVVRLTDTNGDGDAFDVGESSTFWDGLTPAGPQLLLPTALTRGPDGALYLYDNNTLDSEAGPEAIYRLDDEDESGSIEAGEVSLYATLSAAGPTSDVSGFDVAVDLGGRAFFVDTDDDDRIHRVRHVSAGAASEVFLEGQVLFQQTDGSEGLVLSTGRPKLAFAPDFTELYLLAGSFPDRGVHLIGVQDLDGSGRVDDADEIRVLWDPEFDDGPDMGTWSDFHVLSDGSVIGAEALTDRVFRLRDFDDDGRFDSAGEVQVLYDAALAPARGAPVLEQPRFITGLLEP